MPVDPNPDTAFVDALVGQTIAGRYVVERVLRSGGMGVVALGRHPQLQQQVAIKFMRPELAGDEVATARFLREARVAAKAKSPHFVRILDYGRVDPGIPFLVMEMLTGRDLADDLFERGPLPIDVAVDYVLQAAVGLAEIHALGIVHRDLKPANLFLTDTAGTPLVKVLDFGLSTDPDAEGKTLTKTGSLIGTPHYMSPEQIREAKEVDVRTDVWALGVILYELLTGTMPFGHDAIGNAELCALILHLDPTPPRRRREDVPAALEDVILKCLARDPDARYADVAALADALAPFAPPASRERVEAVHRALGRARPAIEERRPVPAPMPDPITRPTRAPSRSINAWVVAAIGLVVGGLVAFLLAR